MPEPLKVGEHSIDVVADLVEYTGLPKKTVSSLLQRRHDNFRLEWFMLPSAIRKEHWYYLSSRTYVFGNAIHVEDWPRVRGIVRSVAAPARILDFGGGSGNLALALAAEGHHVDFLELSALQKDFVRYRAWKQGLADRIRVLDQWTGLAAGSYEAICAFDVLEHLSALAEVLETSVLPAIANGGVLLERSPFGRDLTNPMHHENADELDRTLYRCGFVLLRTSAWLRVWGRASDEQRV